MRAVCVVRYVSRSSFLDFALAFYSQISNTDGSHIDFFLYSVVVVVVFLWKSKTSRSLLIFFFKTNTIDLKISHNNHMITSPIQDENSAFLFSWMKASSADERNDVFYSFLSLNM